MARPTKYRKEFPAILEKTLSGGGFNSTFCAKIGISEETFYVWIKKHKLLSEALKRGKAVSKALFIEKVSEAAWDTENNKVNNGLIALLAVNVHGMVTGKDKADDKQEDATPTLNVRVVK